MVTYELYYTPETAKAQQQGKVVDVDERIAKIEKLVGTVSGEDFDSIVSTNTHTHIRIISLFTSIYFFPPF